MEQINQLRKQLKRTRILAFVVCIFCGLFLIYAYVQKLEADRNLFIAQRAQAELESQRRLAQQNQAVAAENEKRARQMENLARQNEAAAKKALEECQKKIR